MLAEKPPEDGHRQNLLSTSFYQIGVAVLIDAKGIAWVTEDFTIAGQDAPVFLSGGGMALPDHRWMGAVSAPTA
jgi:hypothetical protein